MATGRGRSASAEYGKTASFLAIGVGLTGLITYAYFLIASHVLSKPDYGQITVLWSAVFITISTLYRPVEQLLSRHISERLERTSRSARRCGSPRRSSSASPPPSRSSPWPCGGRSRTACWKATKRSTGSSSAPSSSTPPATSPAASSPASARFGPFTALILSESVFRTSFAVLVAVGLLSGQSAVAIGIVAAPSLSLIVVPLAFLPARGNCEGAPDVPEPDAAEEAPAPANEDFSMKKGGGFAAAVLVIMFSEQAFLNAGPLIARGLEGAAAAGFIFNVLMIARAPLQLFQAVSTSILPHLTSLHTSTAPDSEREFHRSVRGVLLGIAAFAAFTAIVVLIAGPKLMQIAFSDKFTYDRAGLLLVTLGMGLYLGSVTLNQACLAQGQVRRAAARWLGCAAFFIGWNFVPLVSDEFRRVEIGFALTAGVLFALLYLVYRRPHERPEDVPDAGSPEELEARLAAIDENV